MNKRWILAAWMVMVALCSGAQTIVVQNDSEALKQWKEKNPQYAHLIDPVLQALWQQGEEVNEILLKKDAKNVMREWEEKVKDISELVDGMEEQINQQNPDNKALSIKDRDQKKVELNRLKEQEKMLGDSLKKIQTQLNQKKYQQALNNRNKNLDDVLHELEAIDLDAPLQSVKVERGRNLVNRYQQSRQQLLDQGKMDNEQVEAADKKIDDYMIYLNVAEAIQKAHKALATKYDPALINDCVKDVSNHSDLRHGDECKEIVLALLGYEKATKQVKDIITYVRDNSWRDNYSVALLTNMDSNSNRPSPLRSFTEKEKEYDPAAEGNRFYTLLNDTVHRLKNALQGKGDYKESMNFKEYMNKILNSL